MGDLQKRSISVQGSIKDPEQGYWRPSQIGRESIRKGGHDIEVKESVKVDPDSNAFDDDGHVLRTGTGNPNQARRRGVDRPTPSRAAAED